MKQKISITIDEKTIEKLIELIDSSQFRNRSHVIEYAVDKMLRKEE